MTQESEPEWTSPDTQAITRVMLESPYTGDTEANTNYARACLRDSLERGEAPFAGHLLYTQVLDDNNPEERNFGIQASLTWLRFAERMVIYTDLGISNGMKYGIEQASRLGIPIEFRELGGFAAPRV